LLNKLLPDLIREEESSRGKAEASSDDLQQAQGRESFDGLGMIAGQMAAKALIERCQVDPFHQPETQHGGVGPRAGRVYRFVVRGGQLLFREPSQVGTE